MDINRPRKRPHATQKPIDGFFAGSPSSFRRTPASPMNRSAPRSGQQPTSRRVNDFGRADGFYTAPRRTTGVSPGTSGVGFSPRPARPHHAAARTHTIEQQFAPPARHGKHQAAAHPSASKRDLKKLAKKHKKAQRSKAKKILIWASRSLAICLVLLLAVGGVLFAKGYFKLKKVFNGTTTAAALQADVDPTQLKGEGDGRVNILLLGVGGAGHDGGDLTDTIMIASVDPVNNQAVLFSVPRDLWVKMPNNYISNYQKINAAYESGKYKYLGKQDISNTNEKAIQAGFAAADSTIERVMGVPIHYNVLVNFQAFRQAIDTVGGITVNAPEQLYDPTMAWENEWNPVLAKAGINNFDGKHALNYVRSRETSSDFARSQRQRAVMLALKDKVTNLGTLANPVKISGLLSAFGDNVKTDISLNDMQRMVAITKKIPSNQVQSVGLTDAGNNFLTTGNINGLSVVEPRAGLEDYTAIQAFIRSKLKDGYISQENANITLLNGTVTPGLASDKATELKSYGYNIGTVDNAPTTDYTSTKIVDLSGGKKKYTLNYLKQRYHVTSATTTLPPGIVQGNADIVIILGPDATLSTQD
jgi:LCP family protein required for cell wall assembly